MKSFLLFIIVFNGFLFGGGCAVKSKPVQSSVESLPEQMDAAQKVISGMTGRDVSSDDMRRVVRDVQQNPDMRSVVMKVLGSGDSPVEKYSPSTGKHYSGDLEFDPETGEKLEIIKD